MTDFVLWLTWKCLECGWETTMPAPGFAGDGHFHYEQPDNRRCGPLCASKASRVSPAGVILTPEQAEQVADALAAYPMKQGAWWAEHGAAALAVLRPGGAAPQPPEDET